MKTILVVGGAGYIGSHVNKELNAKGFTTIIYDSLVYGHEYAVKWGMFIKGDLADTEKLDHVFSQHRIDAVMHFAAYAYVGESVEDPEKYYLNNVCNTLNLLKVMRKYGCCAIIFSSSCATYGNPIKIPITEEHTQNPINPYGQSKFMVEKILADYDRAYGMKHVIFRYFNAAGADILAEAGEDHTPETHLIPIVLETAFGRREQVSIFGTDYDTPDGTCIRDYIHVTDIADAHIAGLEYLFKGGESAVFNLGNGDGYSVREVIACAEEVTGKKIKTAECPARAGDPAALVGDAKKAERILGWKPRYADLNTIISSAWHWHCGMMEKI